MNTLMIIILFVGYIILMRFVLPKLGVPTWLSNKCDLPVDDDKKNEMTESWLDKDYPVSFNWVYKKRFFHLFDTFIYWEIG